MRETRKACGTMCMPKTSDDVAGVSSKNSQDVTIGNPQGSRSTAPQRLYARPCTGHAEGDDIVQTTMRSTDAACESKCGKRIQWETNEGSSPSSRTIDIAVRKN